MAKPLDLVKNGTSFLAADGSGTTWGKLLGASFGVDPSKVEKSLIPTSRDWVLTNDAIMKNYGSVILLDATARRNLTNGVNTVEHLKSKGINSLVKSDGGLIPFHGGNSGEQLGTIRNGLNKFVAEMKGLGVVGSKCRTATTMDASVALLKASGLTQAQNAAAFNAEGLIGGIEPEVVGKHDKDINAHKKAATDAFDAVFDACSKSNVDFKNCYAKIGFVGNGQSSNHSDPSAVADATLEVMQEKIPADIPLVVFLSGGWEPDKYYAYLSAVVNKAKEVNAPWTIRASASRAAFQCAYKKWGGQFSNINAAMDVMRLRAEACMAACKGEYSVDAHEAEINKLLAS